VAALNRSVGDVGGSAGSGGGSNAAHPASADKNTRAAPNDKRLTDMLATVKLRPASVETRKL
jgi:hypothetical protein